MRLVMSGHRLFSLAGTAQHQDDVLHDFIFSMPVVLVRVVETKSLKNWTQEVQPSFAFGFTL